jgi:hypothetical protein
MVEPVTPPSTSSSSGYSAELSTAERSTPKASKNLFLMPMMQSLSPQASQVDLDSPAPSSPPQAGTPATIPPPSVPSTASLATAFSPPQADTPATIPPQAMVTIQYGHIKMVIPRQYSGLAGHELLKRTFFVGQAPDGLAAMTRAIQQYGAAAPTVGTYWGVILLIEARLSYDHVKVPVNPTELGNILLGVAALLRTGLNNILKSILRLPFHYVDVCPAGFMQVQSNADRLVALCYALLEGDNNKTFKRVDFKGPDATPSRRWKRISEGRLNAVSKRYVQK